MPGRGRSTFNKRQKEISRQEKRREKAARKQQRKLEKQSGFLGPQADSPAPPSPSQDLPPSQGAFAPDPAEDTNDTDNSNF
jgi:hypothetical protein